MSNDRKYKNLRKLYNNQIEITDDYRKTITSLQSELKEKDQEIKELKDGHAKLNYMLRSRIEK